MASRDPSRPNIVFFLTDDQGAWALGCAGNGEIRTPNLDRIAARGIRFESFFCVSPVCSPARASILTGRIPSQHGVHDWLRAGNSTAEQARGGVLIEYLKGQTGYTDILAEHGYVCGISGKWHLGDAHHPQKGFSYWETHAMGGSLYYGAPMVHAGEVYTEERYVTDVIGENGLAFLESQKNVKAPFYLSVHFTAPHSPWRRIDHPPDLFNSYYDNCPFESTPFLPAHPNQVDSAPTAYEKEGRREILSGYYAAVTAADANVGKVLDWLDEHDVTENTIVVFTSDNGMNMGHHGIYGKGNGTVPMNMYDTSVKVPFLISRPGSIPEGVVCGNLLSHYDFMPTLLDYIGMENPEAEKLPGHSFAELLRGGDEGGRESVVVYDEYGPVRMIRTREWKYVHRFPYGPHELYDLAGDPHETRNLIDDPAYADRVKDMKAGLDDWFVRYVDPALDGTHEAVRGNGQMGLAGPAGKGEPIHGDGWRYHATHTQQLPCRTDIFPAKETE